MATSCLHSAMRPALMAHHAKPRPTASRAFSAQQRRFVRLPSPVAPMCRVKATDDQYAVAVPSWVQNIAKTALVSALAVAVAFSHPSAAEAARSGGRAGGSSFSSRGSSMSRSYSGSRGIGGGMGGGMGGSRMTSSYSAPSVTYAPSVLISPFGFGYGGYGGFGASLANIMFIAVLALVAVNVVGAFAPGSSGAAATDEVTVMKVQVGLLGTARTLKTNLDLIAGRADTSGPEGLKFLLQEASLALLRNPDYYVYGAADSQVLSGSEEAERVYDQLSMQERSKFKEETFTNVGGVKRRREMAKGGDNGVNELMVVTMVIAVEGSYSLPKITNTADLRFCLNFVSTIRSSKLIGVELLWTPEAEGDFYTRDEIIEDYPNLVTL